KAKRIEELLGKKGSRVALIFLGFINFNYINAFFGPWLSLSFKELFLYLFIGDFLWFITELVIVYGVSLYINPTYAIYFVLGISVAISVILGFIQKKISQQPKAV